MTGADAATTGRTDDVPRRVCVVGRGRAGGSFFSALASVRWPVSLVATSDALEGGLDPDAELVLLCVPDDAVAGLAAALPVSDARVVAHCAGSLTLDALAPHRRRASVHPLVSLPDPVLGGVRLAGHAVFAVAGEPIARGLVSALDGTAIEVADDRRAVYHAAACVASNHLVGLLGQVERLAASAGVPFDAYLGLVEGTVGNVARLGPRGALTGPAARNDVTTLDRHRAAIDPSELEAYDALVGLCRRLVET